MDFDNILLEIGEFGRYQKFVVYLLCIPACFLNVFNNLGLILQAYTPSFVCRNSIIDDVNNNYVKFNNKCLFYDRDWTSSSSSSYGDNFTRASSMKNCRDFVYNKEIFESTIITDFDLICDRSIYYKYVLSLFNILSIVGFFMYSYVQDRWGRKKAFMISLTAYLFGSLSSLMAKDIVTFTLLRIPSVMGASATWNICYIWGLEYVGSSKRAFVTFVMSILYGVAAIVLAFTAWLCRTWVQLGLAITCPFFALYSFYFLIDESPRWLLSRGRKQEAEKIVQKMAKWQKVTLKDDTLDYLQNSHDDDADADGRRDNGVGFVKLFYNRNLLCKTLLITCIWFSIGITDKTLDYNVKNLRGNFYVAYVFQEAVQIPASFLVLLLLSKFGRVLPLSFSLLVFCGTFSLLTILIVPYYMNIWTGMAFAAAVKLGPYLARTIIYLLGVELYPTTLRGCGICFISTIAGVGTICVPYISYLSLIYSWLPMIIIGTISVISGVGCLLLPETAGQCLPETVDEAANQGAVSLKSLKLNLQRICKIKSFVNKSDGDRDEEVVTTV